MRHRSVEQPAEVLEAIRKVRLGEPLTDTDREFLRRGFRRPPEKSDVDVRAMLRQGDVENCARKRTYDSIEQARRMTRHARWRVHPYRCRVCKKVHVSAADKSASDMPRGSVKGR